MIRFFVWQIGTAGFVAVIWRYGYWREILPLAVLGSAFLWIVCGGILLPRKGRKGARLAHDSPVDADAKVSSWPASDRARAAQRLKGEWEQEQIRRAANSPTPDRESEK